MKKHILALCLFGLCSLASIGQQLNQPLDPNGRQISSKGMKSQPATGSMYTNEKFMPAKLSNAQSNVFVRYNAYSDTFELGNPDLSAGRPLPKEKDVQITLVAGNKEYSYLNYKNKDNKEAAGYLNLLSTSTKVSFYKKERIILEKEFVPENSYGTYKAPAYKKASDEFYIKIGSGDITFLSANKKDVAKLFGAKEKEVLDYIKQNKLDVEKEQDLVKLGTYLDTIL
jgi:hypothetical protein